MAYLINLSTLPEMEVVCGASPMGEDHNYEDNGDNILKTAAKIVNGVCLSLHQLPIPHE